MCFHSKNKRASHWQFTCMLGNEKAAIHLSMDDSSVYLLMI